MSTTDSRQTAKPPASYKWELCLAYCVWLLVGVLAIELRTRPVWDGGSFVSRVPWVVAAFDQVLYPERMQYVATSDLCANHQIQAWDLGFPSPHEPSLESYFPRPENRVGRYLKSAVHANEAILRDNLSVVPVISPEPGSYLLSVRIQGHASEGKLFEPSTPVEIRPSNSTATVKGVIVVGTAEWSSTAASPGMANAPKSTAGSKGPTQSVPQAPQP